MHWSHEPKDKLKRQVDARSAGSVAALQHLFCSTQYYRPAQET